MADYFQFNREETLTASLLDHLRDLDSKNDVPVLAPIVNLFRQFTLHRVSVIRSVINNFENV